MATPEPSSPSSLADAQETTQPDYVAMLAAVDAQIEALQRRQIEASQRVREPNRASDNSLE